MNRGCILERFPRRILYCALSTTPQPQDSFIQHYAIISHLYPAVIHQNHVKFPSALCPGTQTFMPHIPVTMFIGSTMVPSTVNLPRTSLVCSARSFIRMLIWAR
ncbi:hypothetical protein KC330_g53 [Hortaea werneckii]|nr:hypothetical protein KC330_g53 [Hortaea werneckii]